jgi:toxin ParE1/3/4
VKSLPVYYSAEARRDVHSVFDYIAAFRPQAAEQFVESIDTAVQRIASLPQSGSRSRSPRLKSLGYRYVVIGEYLLFYRYSKESLVILRLIHGRRHYVPLLLSR